MKEQSKIPTGKVRRASRLVKTGAKLGVNYIKHYARGGRDRDALDKANAEDIYDSLSELKGSALKMAQVLSMDQNVLPSAYADKFAQAQYSAPPLSLPLVVKTFKNGFGKSPFEMFDDFSKQAVNAASMGQVHSAKLDGVKLAIKVQYPGVGDSVVSDLNLVKPFATRIIGIKGADVEQYFEEVKERLLEETDYELELRRSMEMADRLSDMKGVEFPKYYPEFSNRHIITMEWLQGMHLGEFLKTNPSQELRNELGQRLWDFYNYQVHEARLFHADPHPGNFLFREDGTLGIIDFGCMKELSNEFYEDFFVLLSSEVQEDEEKLRKQFKKLQMIFEDDSTDEQKLFLKILRDSVELLSRPFKTKSFDFGDKKYIKEIFEFGEGISKMPQIRQSKKARGPKDALFVNRTFFGIYNILHALGAEIEVNWDFKIADKPKANHLAV